MIKYYRTDDGVIYEIDDIEDGCWIKMDKPTYEECTHIANKLDIDIGDIRAALDDEESLALSEELAETYGTGDVEELTARYGEAAVNESIGLLRVEDFIIENAQVNELVSNGSLVGQSGDGGAAAQTETEETAEEAQEE